MNYAVGAIAGFAFGIAVGLIKYLLLMKKFFKEDSDAGEKSLYASMLGSYVLNAGALFAVYFARNLMPFDFFACAIGTAVGLTVMSKFTSIYKVVEWQNKQQLRKARLAEEAAAQAAAEAEKEAEAAAMQARIAELEAREAAVAAREAAISENQTI